MFKLVEQGVTPECYLTDNHLETFGFTFSLLVPLYLQLATSEM